MSEFFAIRKDGGLFPYTIESAAVMAKIPHGRAIKITTKAPRNGKMNALYWTMCARIGDAVGAEAETVSDHLKVKTGHKRIIKTKAGIVEYPDSISYAKMDNISFAAFLEKCIQVIYSDFGIARPDVLDAVSDLLEPKGLMVR